MRDTVSFEAFLEQGQQLMADLGVPETRPEPGAAKQPIPTRTRGGFLPPGLDAVVPGLDALLQSVIQLSRAVAPYLGFCLWLVQVVVNRRQKQARKHLELLCTLVAGIFEERGLAEAEKETIQAAAFTELRRYALSEDRARAGSRRVLELLLAGLPPRQPPADAREEFALVVNLARGVPGWQVEEKANGCTITLPPTADRPPRVYLVPRGGLAEFLSICGPGHFRNFEKVLRHNHRLPVGAVTLRSLEGKDYFVLRETFPLEKVTPTDLKRVVTGLAEKASELRQELSLDGSE